MGTVILWGCHPHCADGSWLKLCVNPDEFEIKYRTSQGFELMILPPGAHPENEKTPAVR